MSLTSRRPLTGAIAGLIAGTLLLAGCSGSGSPVAEENKAGSGTTVQVEDNHGTQNVTVPATSVVATDNRTFETLADWGVNLAAAPRGLMPAGIAYKNDEAIVDLGTHREPDMEAVVAAQPDLIINGQRFASKYQDFKKLAPQAAIVELDPRDGKPLTEELKRQTTTLGDIFDKKDEASQLNGDLEAAAERVRKAYQPGQKVMAVNVSGGEIGYVAPHKGRTLGPLYDLFGFTPALEVEGASDDHQGDDISVEAIADSQPDWILVMDRDGAVAADDPSYKPAQQVIEGAEALKNVPAVQKGQVVHMPKDTYTNEGIQTYTEYFNTLADAMERNRS